MDERVRALEGPFDMILTNRTTRAIINHAEDMGRFICQGITPHLNGLYLQQIQWQTGGVLCC